MNTGKVMKKDVFNDDKAAKLYSTTSRDVRVNVLAELIIARLMNESNSDH